MRHKAGEMFGIQQVVAFVASRVIGNSRRRQARAVFGSRWRSTVRQLTHPASTRTHQHVGFHVMAR